MMQPESNDTQQKVSLIEERLKAIERNNSIKGIDAIELSLVLDVIISHNLKCQTLLNTTTCPRANMMIFFQKMVGHTRND